MTAAAILAALATTTTTATIEGYGEVAIRTMTVAERDQVAKAVDLTSKDTDQTEFGLQLVVRCVRDADGNAIFTADDLPALRGCASGKVDALVASVLKANGYLKDADAKN
ncbi:hypothetical protein [Brachymonas sp.]|uniref:hypothetical protein n=1 Tax=Brachymonas sp. TaxID=1936292 RepID=UPI0035ADD760